MIRTREASGTWEGRPVADWAQEWQVPELLVLTRTDSTNDIARQLAARGAPSGTCVIADEQSAGRGRMGRRWHAPAGLGLLFSILLRPDKRASAPGAAPIRAGLAAASAIEQTARVAVGLKWPNDVLVRDTPQKVAGILCESALGDLSSEYVVVGIGINVNQTEADFPAELNGRATSLAIAAGGTIPRAALAGTLADSLTRVGARIVDTLDEHELRDYRQRDILFDREVLVDDAPAGRARGIKSDGTLVVAGPVETVVVAASIKLANTD